VSKGGKPLENLVRQIEALLLPRGFSITANSRVCNDEGIQIAEFDIEIRGRLGSTDIAWLIECRDRPTDGPSPGSWIEQLVGRRGRFGFNKVTAVSTTGFAIGAAEYANREGIELRHMHEITAQDVESWMATQHILLHQPCTSLNNVQFFVVEHEPRLRIESLVQRLQGLNGDTQILRVIETVETISAAEAFARAVSEHPELFADIAPNGPGKPVRLRVSYPNDHSHFVIDTDCGAVRLTAILFVGELSRRVTAIPAAFSEYARHGTGEPIAQSAAFLLDTQGIPLALEMHQIANSGEIHIVARKP